MKITVNKLAIHNIKFKTYNAFAVPPEMQERNFPIYTGIIDGLKTKLKYLIVTSDLQGIVEKDEKKYQLSEILVDEILELNRNKKIEIEPQEVGVILCGDLYTEENQRKGVHGDVRSIWQKYNNTFQFVVGVAGNHDSFGSLDEYKRFKEEKDIYFLDNDIATIRNIKIGGLSGMIGKPTKNQRKDKLEYLTNLKEMLRSECDLILLHEGPNSKEHRIRGNEFIRKVIEETQVRNFIFFGHRNWKDMFLSNIGKVSLLNTDNKCLLLKVKN